MKLTPAMKRDLEFAMRCYPYRPLDFLVISHPLISQSVDYGLDMTNPTMRVITPDNWDDVLEERIALMLEHSKTVEEVLWVWTNKPYRLDILWILQKHLSNKCYSEQLGQCWIDVEFPHQAGVRKLMEMFKKANPKHLMTKKEYNQFNELSHNPELVLYRGVRDSKSTIRGLSWTTNPAKAKWFATRFCKTSVHQQIISARCDPKYRIAYFSGRNEEEVVVNPTGLRILNIEKIGEQT